MSLQTYHIAWSTHTLHTQNQIDAHTQVELWEASCVFVSWTIVSMDSCITLASAYLIPLMLPLYSHRRLPRFTVSFYIWHYVEFDKLINILYRNRNLWRSLFFLFCFVFLHSSHGAERNTCTQPDLQVAQFKIMSCCFVTKWKCFYLWSLRHINVDIVTRHLYVENGSVLVLLTPFPFKRHCCISLVIKCTGFFYISPLYTYS